MGRMIKTKMARTPTTAYTINMTARARTISDVLGNPVPCPKMISGRIACPPSLQILG
jgi:hypothetical protein